MKRYFLMILVAFCASLSAKAINYEDARREAWFLTDKMAYELNLTPEQCDRAYEINLEYFMSVRSSSDCFGPYWRYREVDLKYILFDWQYHLFASLDYFYRPIRWVRSVWYYPVVKYYRPGYYYFDRPAIYVSYRGGRWRHRRYNDVSPYRHVHYRQTAGLRDTYHSGRGGRPVYRPEYTRPSRDFDKDRNDRYNDHRRPNGSNVRPDRIDRPSRDGFHNAGISTNRPSRGDRPTFGDRPGREVHKDKSSSERKPSYRPSRDFGHSERKVSTREHRSHSTSPSRERSSRERSSREFGR